MLPAMMFASCSDELEAPDTDTSGPQPGYITISLRDKAPSTRAEADVDALNENLISTAYVCIYSAGSDDNAVPVLAQSFEVGKNTNAEIEIRLKREILAALFPTGNTCRAYVVANLPEGSVIPEKPSIKDLQNIAIEADFATSAAQPSFVMDGGSELTLTGNIATPSQCTVTGNVDLTRAAAKIRLGVKVAPEVKVTTTGSDGQKKEETWIPQISDGMTVLISSGVNKAKVTPDAKPATDDSYYSTSTNAENETYRGRTLKDQGENVGFRYQLEEPFYTYPNTWSGNDKNMTYMVLTVPFKKENEETYRTCYYTVPVVRDNKITRNVSYMVNISVNILGSFNPDEPLLLEDLSYKAIGWSEESMDVNIKDYRYLVLDQTEYVVNNLDSINIPFYSSHETVIIVNDVKFNYKIYNSSRDGIENTVSVSPTVNANSYSSTTGNRRDSIYNAWIDNNINAQTNARTLTFKHKLKEMTAYNSSNRVLYLNGTDNNYNNVTTNYNNISYYRMTDVDAYSPFEIEITIIHKDLLNEAATTPFKRTIKITQFPAMYIQADPNNYITYNNRPFGEPEYGNLYINGNQGDAGADWIAARGLESTNNRNPNMYVINVTRLANDRYRIGDPRVTDIDNLERNGYNTWTSIEADNLYNTDKRTLSYYYPADGTSTSKMTIAPKFRVASSYGVVSGSGMSRYDGQRRCATYQEKNFPAGRWRLPTYAELEFIISLSNSGKIPILFNAGSNYMTAQGSVRCTLTNGELPNPNANGSAFVRCVYDEWYWESVTPKLESDGTRTWRYDRTDYTYTHYPFTWGDMAR